ncbi:hypothetical protein GUITHDRAFT_111114 [Guillardia theta CCMP2712]|uniref:COMM domain-containing protein n=1 Tax=Guillardia theta (strain CCMP2712) TaxID=905079 RepID=L1J3S7_GUITC|nr:hypothetical protein GUITHDRAFT_111114 [Guillardia theta CCMP2712]EKX42745.1 hypothetical protein GUITHDRAFT_111114 [Guillardia theta CCMP2712]|eukprot:XP_005829725.1 hypothetical protein GUITHDRAFT_111114 [Guillardia theta CCMP2712]
MASGVRWEEAKEDVRPLNEMPHDMAKQILTIAREEILHGRDALRSLDGLAEEQGMDVDRLCAITDAIVFIVMEAAKCKMSEQEFLNVVSGVGVEERLQEEFSRVYGEVVDYSREISFRLQHELPSLSSMQWRLDVQLGSRCLQGQCSPSLMMKFGVAKGKETTEHLVQAEICDVQKICDEIQSALQEAKSNHARKVTRLLK